MFAAALRTLRNAAEAEDVLQDAWLRWQNVDREIIRDAAAFLTTTTVRLAINRALGARTRHETSLDSWLSEATDNAASPGSASERGEAIEAALRMLFEQLTPVERAVYLLREAFGYSYKQSARVVGTSEANARQLATRARKHLAGSQRAPVPFSQLRRLCEAFAEATRGELAPLEAALRADIVEAQ